ncbi:MAG: Rieske (2Fe-2S) protein [Alphaproteobacteria bacterium]|nr:Rieske (2Fe-2S) protein [Alphaproteobacteria bacterium]
MDLPQSIATIGGQLDRDETIVAAPELLSGADVFAAERQRLFLRPWVAVDHHSRLEAPGRYVRVEAATRSILLVRDGEGGLRALRNVCIHAGYPVCEAEEGPAERLICPYHGWEFAADGRLMEPDLSSRIDPARLRLASHPVAIRDGLIFVDPSNAPSAETSDPPITAGVVPSWLKNGKVTSRPRCSVDWNWKLALQFIRSSPHLFCDDPDEDDVVVFGPLSMMFAQPGRATLLRVIPKSAARTDIQLIYMAANDTSHNDGSDQLANGLRKVADAEAGAGLVALDRSFFSWYWPLMSAG